MQVEWHGVEKQRYEIVYGREDQEDEVRCLESEWNQA